MDNNHNHYNQPIPQFVPAAVGENEESRRNHERLAEQDIAECVRITTEGVKAAGSKIVDFV
jgi:hypothetical protein